MALTRRVALIDMTGHIDSAELAKVAAAIDLQVRRDVAQFWPISAIVSTLPSPIGIPPGVWPMFVVSYIDDATAGFHKTRHYQPYGEIEDGPGWSLAASHEILEMLIDPSGNDLVAATEVDVVNGNQQTDTDRLVEYLLEICDPCETPDCAYLIDGVLVSDFCTPAFYESEPIPGARYTFRNKIDQPRRVLPGGYMSWWDAEKHMLRRLDYTDPTVDPVIKDVGLHPPNECMREFVDTHVRKVRKVPRVPPNHPILARQARQAAATKKAALARAGTFGP
jgi:hypothetical protein